MVAGPEIIGGSSAFEDLIQQRVSVVAALRLAVMSILYVVRSSDTVPGGHPPPEPEVRALPAVWYSSIGFTLCWYPQTLDESSCACDISKYFRVHLCATARPGLGLFRPCLHQQ